MQHVITEVDFYRRPDAHPGLRGRRQDRHGADLGRGARAPGRSTSSTTRSSGYIGRKAGHPDLVVAVRIEEGTPDRRPPRPPGDARDVVRAVPPDRPRLRSAPPYLVPDDESVPASASWPIRDRGLCDTRPRDGSAIGRSTPPRADTPRTSSRRPAAGSSATATSRSVAAPSIHAVSKLRKRSLRAARPSTPTATSTWPTPPPAAGRRAGRHRAARGVAGGGRHHRVTTAFCFALAAQQPGVARPPFDPLVVGITGSIAKTSTKEQVAEVLGRGWTCCATRQREQRGRAAVDSSAPRSRA